MPSINYPLIHGPNTGFYPMLCRHIHMAHSHDTQWLLMISHCLLAMYHLLCASIYPLTCENTLTLIKHCHLTSRKPSSPCWIFHIHDCEPPLIIPSEKQTVALENQPFSSMIKTQLPSVDLLHSHGTWPIYRWFPYEKLWYSMAMLNNQMV